MTARRTVLAAASLLAAPLAADAQPARKIFRIGVLTTGVSGAQGAPDLLRQNLRELGYVEGVNLSVEVRDPGGRVEQFDDFATELVRLGVDAIVAVVPAATIAARKATSTIPIVMVNTPDPVQLGLVASLGRPGGNITGTTTLTLELSVKQFELLREAVPQATRFAVAWNPANPWHSRAVEGVRAAANPLAARLQALEVRGPDEFDGAFAAMTRERAEAVLVLADPLFVFHAKRLADLAVRHRLPAMYGTRSYVDAGGLMSYWAHQADLFRRTASYVDRILKGAKPADLPVEQPTRFELVINLKAAAALGLTVPAALLQRADEVIE